MNRFVLLIILTITLSNCSRNDCQRRLDNMKVYSSVTTENFEPASYVPGYYHAEVQSDSLTFTLEFDHIGAGDRCDYFWLNYPIQESIEIYCDRTIILNGSEILPNEPLIDIFRITKYESESFTLAFLISQNSSLDIEFPLGFYTFEVKLETENGEMMDDKCILKYQ